ncbi:DNA phosphorothioation-dependent restriction protein DptH [Salipaludibacillus daqingensis]|uniref:DNA phosphorothioation-dependent restriction protein DptH n=1 Tax=Salipaludibacillus daqingensis TaxID=3041001 RepID=UPI002476D671|nr:DNA phosphorothioation-dependent restriction protein DptH [Salipaludibacillus daqingensis]
MSNPFFKYISEMLVRRFQGQINPGDRFYVQLDSKREVEGLINELEQLNSVENFEYKHETGTTYQTFAINIDQVKLVVASTSEGVTPDFLVTLRNQVGDQLGVWENTALLSIVSEQLDSIQGGSSDLQKEGMPLHSQSLNDYLKNDIENSVLRKVDQTILLENLKRLMEDQFVQQVSLLDFQEIFRTLTKGSLEDEDYKRFGLFKDHDLQNKTGKELTERLKSNYELFEQVQRIHDFGAVEEDLEKKFSNKGVQFLKQDNWIDTSFSVVYNAAEEKEKENKDAKVKLQEIKIPNFKYWERPQKENSAGQRKRQIIIFNDENKDSIHVQAKFEVSGNTIKNLSDEFITIPNYSKAYIEYDMGRKNINLKLKPKADDVTFIRVNYKHEKRAALGAEFHIVIVPFSEKYLYDIETRYTVNVAKNFIELNSEIEELKIGAGKNTNSIDVIKDNQLITVEEDEGVLLIPQSDAFDEQDLLNIKLQINKATLNLLLKNQLPETTPIRALRIWRLKREMQQNFIYSNNRLVIGNREFYTHSEYNQFLQWELEWIKNGFFASRVEADKLYEEELKIHEDLREAYSRFLTYFKIHKSTPSLCFVSEEYEKRAKDYIFQYIKEIKKIRNSSRSQERIDLMRLGTQKDVQGIYLTPFHPLVISYQLKVNERLKNNEIDQSILERLSPSTLLPFIYDENDERYRPDSDIPLKEWIKFKPVNEVSVSDASNYLAKVVEDKLKQFEEHFTYLFVEGAKASVKVNVINISNDLEVLRGILKWIVTRIDKKGPDSLNPIEVSLYFKDKQDSVFDQFSKLKDPDEVYQLFNVKLSSKKYDPNDILRFIRQTLFYFKHTTDETLEYAHLSFYKMMSQENFTMQPMEDMLSGVSLDGILSSVPAMKSDDSYRSGFGVRAYEMKPEDTLLQVVYSVNELAANVRNKGSDAYRPGVAIMSRTTTDDEETLNKIFRSSYWVTFVDPTVDLEYFQSYDRNLVVIHYSDQYTSSSRYDAITVTDKSKQYNNVIKQYLKGKGISVSDEDVTQTIKSFNAFNGEWLLRIIGSKGHYDREKLSILSAIKYTLSYFDHKNIVWVPISLEEILRVAGAVGLTKKDGVFTAKNLGVSGSHSDDLLLIGLESRDEELLLHFYPVEVKIGKNNSPVIEKAKAQLRQTKKLFTDYLTKYDDEGNINFTHQFYRQFFVQLFIANFNKLAQSDFWPEKKYELADETRYKLLSDNFSVSEYLVPLIGKGAIMSFETDRYVGGVDYDEEVTTLYLNEADGSRGIIESVQSLADKVKEGKTDFPTESLIQNNYQSTINEEREEQVQEGNPESEDIEGEKPSIVSGSLNVGTKTNDNPNEPSQLEDVRILIGEADKSNQHIYWEYGNKELANRHLLISGKSGQGKTYFMQCLLLEQALQGISSIIIDYTEGFLPNQLEEEFVETLGEDRLKQTIVYNEKFPINPFKRNVRNIGGIEIEENETDIAERIKSVFGAVYPSLGIQQLNAIYEATQQGVLKYSDQMTLSQLKNELEELDTSYAKKTLSQIRNLIDRNPFTSSQEEVDWEKIINSNGTVNIIQLTAYPRDVQLMITEFILWDLWNHSVRKGNKHIPIPVVLDEAQNLDHREHSPSARILTEGRKFGWSGWYATQFLKSQLDGDELARLQNSSQKVYFSPPEQEISGIANSLSKEKEDKKYWEQKLSSLRKGQCIVHGPILHNGKLTEPIAQVVNITAINKRI